MKIRASPTWKIFHKSILTSYIEFNFEYKLTALNHREFNTFYKKLKLTQFRLLMLFKFKLIKYQKTLLEIIWKKKRSIPNN